MENSPRKPRRGGKYDIETLEQIMPFKESFVKSITIAERAQILQTEILPAMFTYWSAKGKNPKDEEESKLWAKVL